MYIYFSNEKKKEKLARTFLKEFSTVLFRNPTCIGNSFSSYSKKVRVWQLLKIVAIQLTKKNVGKTLAQRYFLVVKTL